jgi:gas vesicle protein
VVVAFLAGALTATAAALLLAPRSGAATRARIGEMVGRTEEQLRRAAVTAGAAGHAAKEAFTEALRDGA